MMPVATVCRIWQNRKGLCKCLDSCTDHCLYYNEKKMYVSLLLYVMTICMFVVVVADEYYE